MRTSKFTNEQIVQALRQAESGTPVVDICRKLGASEQTFYRWKKKFMGLDVSDVRELKQLRDENRKSKSLVAELSLDKTKRTASSSQSVGRAGQLRCTVR